MERSQDSISLELLVKSQDPNKPAQKLIKKYEQILQGEINKACSVLKGHSDEVTGISLSIDSNSLISCSKDGTIILWDLISRAESQKILFNIEPSVEEFTSIALYPNNQLAIAGTKSGSIYLVSLTEKLSAKKDLKEFGSVSQISICKDNLRFLTRHQTGTVKIWNLPQINLTTNIFDAWSDVTSSFLKNLENPLKASTLLSTDDFIVVGYESEVIIGFDAITYEPVVELPVESQVNALDLNKAKGLLAIGQENEFLTIYDFVNKKNIYHENLGHGGILGVCFKSTEAVFCSTTENKILFFSLNSKKIERCFIQHSSRINQICDTRDGNYLITASKDKTIKFSQIEEIRDFGARLKLPAKFNSLDIDNVNGNLVTIDEKERIIVYSLNEQREILRYGAKEMNPCVATLTGDGKYLIIVSPDFDEDQDDDDDEDSDYDDSEDDNLTKSEGSEKNKDGEEINISHQEDDEKNEHNERSGEEEKSEEIEDQEESGEQEDQEEVKNTLAFFSCDKKSFEFQFEAKDEILGLCACNESKYLCGFAEDFIYIWNIASKKQLHKVKLRSNEQASLCISPKKQSLYAASGTHLVEIDLFTGKIVKKLKNHESEITCILFSKDGTKLFTGDENGKIGVWNPEDNELIANIEFFNEPILSINLYNDKLVVTDKEKKISIVNLEEHKEECSFEVDFNFFSVAIIDQSDVVAFGTSDFIKFWSLTEKKQLYEINAHDDEILALYYFKESNSVISVSHDNTIKEWSLESKEISNLLLGHTSKVTVIIIRDDTVVLGSDNGQINVLSISEKKLTNTIYIHYSSVQALDISGNMYATGGSDNLVTVGYMNSNELTEFEGHENVIFDVKFNGNNKFVISASADDSIRVWNIEKEALECQLLGHRDTVTALCIFPDGKLIASASIDRQIKLWDWVLKTEVASIEVHSRGVNSLTLSDDGKYLLSGSDDNSIGISNVSTKNIVCYLNGHCDQVNFLKTFNNILYSKDTTGTLKTWLLNEKKEFFSYRWRNDYATHLLLTKDNKYLISGYSKGSIRFYNFEKKKFEESINLHGEEAITGLAIDSKSDLLYSAANQLPVQVWSISQKKVIRELEDSENNKNCIELTADDKYLAVALNDNKIRVWEVLDFEYFDLKGHVKEIFDLKSTSDGLFLFSCSDDCMISKWDLTKKNLALSYKKQESPVKCLAIAHKANVLIAGLDNQKLIFLNAEKDDQIGELIDKVNKINSISISKDEKLISTGDDEGKVFILGFEDKTIRSTFDSHTNQVYRTVFSHDSNTLYSSAGDFTIISYDLSTATSESYSQKCLRPTSGNIMCILINKLGTFAYTGSDAGTINIFDFQKKNGELACILGHKSTVSCLALNNSENLLASGSFDNSIRVHSTADYSFKFKLEKHQNYVRSILIHPDKEVLYSASDDFCIFVWSLVSKEVEFSFEAHNNNIYAICLNSNYLLSASRDSTVKQWDLNNKNKDPVVYDGHSNGVYCLVVLNEKNFISGGGDSLIKVWDIAKKREDFTLSGHNEAVNTLALTEDRTQLVSGSDDKVINIWDLEKRTVEHVLDSTNSAVLAVSVFSNLFMLSGSEDRCLRVWKLSEKEAVNKFKTQTISEIKFFTEDDSYELLFKYGDLESVSNTDPQAPKKSVLGITNIFDPYYQNLILFYNVVDTLRSGQYSNFTVESNEILFSRFSYSVLHILCLLSDGKMIEKMIDDNLTLKADYFGKSPLFYAIKKQNQDCVDAVLGFLIGLSEKSDCSKLLTSFSAISNDISDIIQNSSKMLHLLINNFFIPCPVQFEKMSGRLPAFNYSFNFKPIGSDFNPSILEKDEQIPVVLKYSPFKIPTNPGCVETIKFLEAIYSCTNGEIFKTPFIKFVIKKHWDDLKVWTYGYTFLLFLNLILLLILFAETNLTTTWALPVFFLVNFILVVWESIQFLGNIWGYFTDVWNIIDFLRITTTCTWIFLCIFNEDREDFKILAWTVALLNFLRGLTAFRAFDGTRYYVKLILRAIDDMLFFFILLAYSTMTFGVMFQVSRHGEPFEFKTLWMNSYNLNFGSFESQDEYSLSIETAAYLLATTINVILMLNLLISILGESFGNFQNEKEIIDYTERISVVLEIQKLMFWVDKTPVYMYFHAMTPNSDEGGSQNVDEKIEGIDKQIKGLNESILNENKSLKNELIVNSLKLDTKFDETFGGLGKKIENLESQVGDYRNEVKAVQDKVNELGENMKEILALLKSK